MKSISIFWWAQRLPCNQEYLPRQQTVLTLLTSTGQNCVCVMCVNKISKCIFLWNWLLTVLKVFIMKTCVFLVFTCFKCLNMVSECFVSGRFWTKPSVTALSTSYLSLCASIPSEIYSPTWSQWKEELAKAVTVIDWALDVELEGYWNKV